MIIAIDGPAASGKSTTAKKVAEVLGFKHIDTGAMYRAVALHFIQLNINILNDCQVISELESVNIKFSGNDFNSILLNDVDVTKQIRNSEVNSFVSKISAIQAVREKLVIQQRKIAKNKNVVVEGRDIGTRVFPSADYKFFITADLEVRAKRRLEENLEICKNVPFNQMVDNLKKRDELDENRNYSPLKIPEDATIIDTSNLTIEEQVQKIVKQININ